ncbi:hypothetical protein [Arthrobacter sp. MDT1-65]
MSTSLTRPKRRARVVTIVWGAVLLAVAVLILVGQFVSLTIDPVIVALGLLVGVGLSLVAGGILSLRTRPTPEDHDDGLSTY